MRLRYFFALCISLLHPAAFADGDFGGVWVAAVCPSGVKNDPARCSHFVLELFQKQDKLCGSHMFATPDGAEVDEGSGAPSLTGAVAGKTATAQVASTRIGAAVEVELTMLNNALRWRRLDKPRRNDLLPVNARFVKSRAKTLLNPLFAQQLSASCSMISNQPAEKGAPGSPSQEPLRRPGKTGLAENGARF